MALKSKDFSSRIKVPHEVKSKHQLARQSILDAIESYIVVDEETFHKGEWSGHQIAIRKVVTFLEAWNGIHKGIPQHIIDEIKAMKVSD